MKNELTKQQTDAIIEALDKAIETGPWDESNFLRVIGKNLKDIRTNFANQLSSQDPTKTNNGSPQINQDSQRLTQQEVFIGLYSSEGNNLQTWERILSNLPRQMISRPIYAEEEGIKSLIKSKENKANEAYVAIFVSQADILQIQRDKMPLDRFGRPLMSLKDRSLSLDNITRFMHISGTYNYVKGHLVRVD